jgi:hypothetical protein
MRVMRVLLALGLLELGAPATTEATTLVLMKTEAIAAASDQLVAGRVIATEARWDRSRIVTRVRLRADSGGADVWFEHPGGTVDGLTMRVLGMPEFRLGERTMVLLARRLGRLRLVGLSEGKLAIVERGGREVVFLRLHDDGPLEPVALDDARALLAAVVATHVSPP